jgi:hypothetical protein
MRNPSPPARAMATAMAAAPVMVSAEWLAPAKPTLTIPVLVTGPLAAAVVPMPGLLGTGVVLLAGAVPPMMAAELVLTGTGGATAVVGTALGTVAAGVVAAGWLVVVVTPAETVMVNDGFPPPQSAVTVYLPEAFEAIIAVPEKLIWVVVTVATPPTNADE